MICWMSALSFFFKPKTAYEMRISHCSSDVCSSNVPDFLPGADIAPRKVNGHNRSQVRQLHDGMIDGDVGRSEIGLAVEAQELPVLFSPLRCHSRNMQSFRRKTLHFPKKCLGRAKKASRIPAMTSALKDTIRSSQIERAHVCNPVTNAHLESSIL